MKAEILLYCHDKIWDGRSSSPEAHLGTTRHPIVWQTSSTQFARWKAVVILHSSPFRSITIYATWDRNIQCPCHHTTHKTINSFTTPIKSTRVEQTRSICATLQNGENLDKYECCWPQHQEARGVLLPLLFCLQYQASSISIQHSFKAT